MYARIDPLTLAVTLIDITQEQFNALDGNPKQAWLRQLVIDAKPVPSASQVVVDAGYVIEPTQVRQTWALRNKTADELEAESLAAEKVQITTCIAEIQTQLDISNAAFNAMTTAQKFDVLRDDRRASMKAIKFLLRQAKRSL